MGGTVARTSGGPQRGPQTSPSRREAGRREQAKREYEKHAEKMGIWRRSNKRQHTA